MNKDNSDSCGFSVSVAICSYNRQAQLAATLEALKSVLVPEDMTAELILVDNASTDETYSVMQAFSHPEMPVRVAKEARKGLSHARNRAVTISNGRVVLFTDDDVRFPDNWIVEMAEPILRGDADAVAGGVQLDPTLNRRWMTPRHRELLASTERLDPSNADHFVGANMAIGRHVFDVIPKFDEELGAGKLGFGEETLFSRQMLEQGFSLHPRLDVKILHLPHQDRLSYNSFISTANKAGASEAYVSYHWKHKTYSFWKLFVGLQILVFRLTWLRLTTNDLPDSEGIDIREFLLVRQISRVKHHLTLRGTIRNYSLRGCNKIETITNK